MELLESLLDAWPQLWSGIQITLGLSLGGAALAFAVAVVLGLAAISEAAVLRGVSRVVVEFFRGTSLVVQLFWLFFVLPQFGLRMDSMLTGIIALGLNYGAYGAEVVRGSLNAVPKAQWEGTTALSMSWATKMRRIIWPQAWALMLPGLNNLMVMLVKGTALALLIFLHDLTFVVDNLRRTEGTYFAFGVGFALYYLISLGFSSILRALELRAQRKLGLKPTKAQTTKATAGAVA
ncbi:amino acid ABC transporter permease [Actinotalea sp. C106]|uniref:amino acid ABC transporter permease n=1 Tax=Actinotalea sp. C106 TaxID=2908644 RepID=UPI00202839A2|nr:amino acid ABC transporter permease [Actinotalea sp. C106]